MQVTNMNKHALDRCDLGSIQERLIHESWGHVRSIGLCPWVTGDLGLVCNTWVLGAMYMMLRTSY